MATSAGHGAKALAGRPLGTPCRRTDMCNAPSLDVSRIRRSQRVIVEASEGGYGGLVIPEAAIAPAHVELLGLLAQGSLSAFAHTANASSAAWTTEERLDLARIAAQRFSHLGRLEAELSARGAGLVQAMEPFGAPSDDFGAHTRSAQWPEMLVKNCIIGGLASDFADAVRPSLPSELAEILMGSLDDGDLAGRPAEMLAGVLAKEPDLQGRLALHGRRLLGEALSQVQRVAAGHPELTGLITGVHDDSGDDLAAISQLMADLATSHSRRMESLGLA